MNPSLIVIVVIALAAFPIAIYLLFALLMFLGVFRDFEWLPLLWSLLSALGFTSAYLGLDSLHKGTTVVRRYLYSFGILVGMFSASFGVSIIHPATSLSAAYIAYGPMTAGAILIVFLVKDSWIKR